MLVYLYRRRLRAHGAQELLAGDRRGDRGRAACSRRRSPTAASPAPRAEVVHAVVGPATLQLRARNAEGFYERRSSRAWNVSPASSRPRRCWNRPRPCAVPTGVARRCDLPAPMSSLALLDGLAHTLPLDALSPGGIGLSPAPALQCARRPAPVRPRGAEPGTATAGRAQLRSLRGRVTPLRVSAVLGAEAAGALASAPVAVMPLERLQSSPGCAAASRGSSCRPARREPQVHAEAAGARRAGA